MRHTKAGACLDLSLLRHVRDANPTQDELCEWLGTSHLGRLHVLRKASLFELVDHRLRLSAAHLSADGKRFHFENKLYLLDEIEVRTF